MKTPLLILLLVGAALAGCTGTTPTPTTSSSTTTSTMTTSTMTTTTLTTPTTPTQPENTSSVNASDYSIETAGVPASVTPGENFTFTLYANGTKTHASDHIGAHFGHNSTNGTTTSPSTTFYDQACVHQAGNPPGVFTVTCNMPTAGVYYLRGHMRINDSGTLVNFWSNESKVLAVGAYTLQTSLQNGTSATNTAHLNQPFTFTLWVNGTGNLTSDHIGAHYNESSQASSAPSTVVYGEACTHQAGSVPGMFTVTCTFANVAAPIEYLRGHMRLTDAAGRTYNFWSEEYTIAVAPV